MGGSAAGSNKKTYTILAYLLGWITGLIFLFVGKDDPDVKWNAANSIIIFGGLSIVNIILSLVGLGIVAAVITVVGFVYWVIFMFQALQGNGGRIPAPGVSSFLNRYVDQLANAVH
jgi:uncharacterized membrane protein